MEFGRWLIIYVIICFTKFVHPSVLQIIVPRSHTQKKVKTYYVVPILSHKSSVPFLKTNEVQKANNFSPHIHWPHAEIWSEFNSPNIY